MSIKVTVEKTTDGYSAYANDYNIFSSGSDLQELKTNMLEAVSLYFEDGIEIQEIEFSINSQENPFQTSSLRK